jgi:hypothetical protein
MAVPRGECKSCAQSSIRPERWARGTSRAWVFNGVAIRAASWWQKPARKSPTKGTDLGVRNRREIALPRRTGVQKGGFATMR